MAILTIDVLKKIVENLPDDFTVEYSNNKIISPINDKVEIDISGKRLILK